MRAFSAQNGGDGSEQDIHVGLERLIADVLDIERGPTGEIPYLAAPGDLPVAGYSGLDREKQRPVFTVLLKLRRRNRARAHKAHVAGDNVEKLRQLVEAGGAEKSSERGDPDPSATAPPHRHASS